MNSPLPGFRVTERHRRVSRWGGPAPRVRRWLAAVAIVTLVAAAAVGAAGTVAGTETASSNEGETVETTWAGEQAPQVDANAEASIEETIEETIELDHPRDEPERIEATLSYEIPTNVTVAFDFSFIGSLENVTVVETDGFSGDGDGAAWNGTDSTASITVRYDRWLANHDYWTVTEPHEEWAIGAADPRGGTGIGYDGYAPEIETETTVPPGAILTGNEVLFGVHTVDSRTVETETIRLIAPETASLAVPEADVLERVAYTASRLDVGERTDDLPLIVVPGDDVRTNGPSAFARSSAAYGFDTVDAGTWVHEYVHTREYGPATTDETRWLVEGVANYYEWLHAFESGHATFDGFTRRLETGAAEEDVVLADPVTWDDVWENHTADYTKGALVAAALDREIRAATDGTATFADVFEAWNGHVNGGFDQAAFEAAVESAAGPEVRESASTYTTTDATPRIGSASAYALYFDGDVPPDESFGELSGTVVDEVTGDAIGGATVVATVPELDRTFETTVDADGSYRLAVPDGMSDVAVSATAPHYLDGGSTVDVEVGETTTLEIGLRGDATVSGRVDLYGSREANATITARDDGNRTWETTADADGAYELSVPGTGAVYAIEATARGFETAETDAVVDGDGDVTDTDFEIDQQTTYFAIQSVDAPDEVEVGDAATVDVTVANLGREAGTDELSYRIGGTTVANETVTLNGTDEGEVATTNVTVEHRHDGAGTVERSVATSDESVDDLLTVDDAEAAPPRGGGPAPAPRVVPDVSIDHVEPSARTVAPGEPIAVEVVLVNPGDAHGSMAVEFAAGTTTERVDAAVGPGAETVLTFTARFDAVGTGTIRVNDVTVPIEVAEPGGSGAAGDADATAMDASSGETDGEGVDGAERDDEIPGFGVVAGLAAVGGVALLRLARRASTVR